jgi:hypothetical protein
VVQCTRNGNPISREQAVLLRTLFNRLADNRPAGRRRGLSPIRPQEQRQITLAGARVGRLRNIIHTLESGQVVSVEVL